MMNGKVNAVTLGLANLYTNKVVKKLSEEMASNQIPFYAQFQDIGFQVMCTKKPEEFYPALSNNRYSVCFEYVNLLDEDGNIRRFCTRIESSRSAAGKPPIYTFYFGDDAPRIVVNTETNKISSVSQ